MRFLKASKAIPWEDFLPVHAAFPVKGHSLDSKLFSVPHTVRRLLRKPMWTRLGAHYGVSWFEETGVSLSSSVFDYAR